MIIGAQVGDLLQCVQSYQLDGIMNAANGRGPMGRGIAGAIRRAAGDEVEQDAYRVCNTLNPKRGEAYCTIPGRLGQLGVKNIIHAVTMKNPGEHSSLIIIEQAFSNALKLAKEKGIERIGCTALGTGIGRVDHIQVARVMSLIANSVDIGVFFADHDLSFIDNIS